MSTTAEPPFRSSRYTTGAILLHWLIAAGIIAQIIGGWLMVELLRQGSALQFDVYQLHKSIGITILALTVARVLWRLFNPPPPEPASVKRLERVASHTVHLAFYGLMVAIPLTGWLMITVAPVQVETTLFFQSFLPWPHVPGLEGLGDSSRTALYEITKQSHAILAYGTAGLLALHVAGAVKHHIADGHFLKRMSFAAGGDGPRNAYGHATAVGAMAGFVAIMVVAATLARQPDVAVAGVSPDQADVLTSAAEPAAESAGERARDATGGGAQARRDGPTRWAVDPATSTLTFTATMQGSAVEGRFGAWQADIAFDPDALEASQVAVTIDTASAEIGSGITETQLKGSDGFAVDDHETARFVSDTIRPADDGDGYVADGSLTIRGETVDETLPFTVDIDGDTARATGALTVNRFDYGIGTSNDAEGSTLAPEVTIAFTIEATANSADDVGDDAATAAADDAPALEPWRVVDEESAVTFTVGFQGNDLNGAIGTFDATILFDPDRLDASSVKATLDLTSATIEGSGISTTQLKGADGLAVEESATARFEAPTIVAADGGGYVAEGTLTLRGQTEPVALPFTLTKDGARAAARGEVAVERLAFGIGAENDPDGTMLAPNVTIAVDITAVRPGSGSEQAAAR